MKLKEDEKKLTIRALKYLLTTLKDRITTASCQFSTDTESIKDRDQIETLIKKLERK